MITFDSFAANVRDALAHIYDRIYLRSHPLTALLTGNVAGSPPDDLRLRLLDAIEQLRPPDPCPPSAPAWRPYRYMVMRYVEGATPEAVAVGLRISLRQSRREHDHALTAVTRHLWDEYTRARGLEASAERDGERETRREGEREELGSLEPERSATNAEHPLRGELLRIGGDALAEPISVRDALDDSLDIASQFLAQRHALLESAIPEDLPQVRFHRRVLRQALLGLLTCAAESRPEPTLAVDAAVSGGSVRITIAVPTVEPPLQSPQLDERLRSTRTLVELQNGRLVVGAHPGEAFSAELFLPLASPRCLLVVDDNPDIAYLFSRYLRDEGYRIIQASTGETAVQLARQERPDVITLDVLMPSEDGWDTLRRLARDPDTLDIPVILCSVLPERSLAMSLGVAGFLDKPVKKQDLIDALHRCPAVHR